MSSKLCYLLLFPIALMFWILYNKQLLIEFGNRNLLFHKIVESFQPLKGKRNMKLEKSLITVEEVQLSNNKYKNLLWPN